MEGSSVDQDRQLKSHRHVEGRCNDPRQIAIMAISEHFLFDIELTMVSYFA